GAPGTAAASSGDTASDRSSALRSKAMSVDFIVLCGEGRGAELGTPSFVEADLEAAAAVPQGHCGARWAAQAHSREPPFPPVDVQLHAAARTHAVQRAFGPRPRQRGQQVNLAAPGLHDHLEDAGSAAEVAVDLERWMR